MIIAATIALAAALGTDHCDRVLFGGWSYHADRTYDYNETHHMVGVQCHGVSAMQFTNSYDHESYGVGYEHLVYRWGDISVGGYAGAWTGYDDPVTPVAGLRVRYDMQRFGIVTTIAGEVNTVHLEWRFQ